MFERYTEKARRVIFFARYEASQFGSPYIETEHLLLGLLREDKALSYRFLRPHASVESIRTQIEGHTTIREKVSTSVDLPLSNECKRVLAYAAEEAERLSHQHIGTEHLLLGLMREKGSMAATVLREEGMDLEELRRAISASAVEPLPTSGTTYAGGVGVAGWSGQGAVVEFVCNGAVITSVVLFPGSPLPRGGEQVNFKDKDGADATFRVEEVSYVYERFQPDMVASHRLVKVVIRIRRDEPSS